MPNKIDLMAVGPGWKRKAKQMQNDLKKKNNKKGRHRQIFIVLMIILLISSLSAAQDASVREFGLEDVRKFAVSHSYDSKKTQFDILAAKKKLKEMIATGLPQINSTLGYMNNLELTTMLIPNFFEGKFDEKIAVQFGTQHNLNVNFSLSQLLFNGSYFVGLQTSSIYRQLADQNHERTLMNVLETVTNTYYMILVSDESEKILNTSLANLEKTHYEIREMYKEGFLEETDADLIQISVTRIMNNLQAIRRNKEIGYKLLKFQMGLDLEEKIVLKERLEDILQKIDVEQASEGEFKLENNIDFKLMSTQEKLSEMALKNEKAKYLPTITAFYTFQWNAMRDAFNFFSSKEKWYRMQVLGVNISIPIFQSGRQSAKVQQASISLQQARNAKRQASQGLVLEAARTKAAIDSAYENYLNTQENMHLSKKVYDVTLIKYKEGVASSMDLTQAHDKFLMSQSEYIQALSGLLSAKNKLDRLNNNYESFD